MAIIANARCTYLFAKVAETCQLAAARISWLKESRQDDLPESPYLSVDPAPPSVEKSIGCLKMTLLDENADLFERYRAMFALRNLSTPEAALALAEGKLCMGAMYVCYSTVLIGNRL